MDPKWTGQLDYHKFKDLIEEKEPVVSVYFNSVVLASSIMTVAKCWTVFL